MHKNEAIQIFQIKPEGFNSKVQVASAYVVADGKLLLLQLSSKKSEAGAWGVPAGKLEAHESPESAVRRELYEETGIALDPSVSVDSLGCLYVRKPDVDYVYHMYKIYMRKTPEIRLSEEHQAHAWILPGEAENLHLMNGGKDAFKFFQASLHPKLKRTGTSLNAYLILRKADQVLLLLRKNTGYADGFYGLISGHIEDGESASAGMMREAYEEAGIEIEPSDLKMVHVMHSRTNRQNVDFFFECTSWKGAIVNKEPEKCAALEFFSLHQLPKNIVLQVEQALRAIARGETYSELGWK